MAPRVLIFATDLTPLPGLPTSGTALRTFGLAEGLKANGAEVSISVPRYAIDSALGSIDRKSLSSETNSELDKLNRLAFTSNSQQRIVDELKPDLIICGHWPAMMLRVKPSQPLVIDLAGPHLLERHYQASGDHKAASLAKLISLATADYFIVAGPSQRLYFLSYLLRTELERLEDRIIQISMPLSPKLPDRQRIQSESSPRFIFGGVFLPWQDPSWGLRKLLSELDQRKKGTLTLIGGKHPHYDVKTGTYESLFSDLSKNPRVTTKPLLHFDNFVSELASADVAFDLMQWNLERELAVTTRSTTYLWAGLPVIYNDFADLAGLIQRYDAGWCVSPGNDDELLTVLDEIYSDPGILQKKSDNARLLASTEFSWDQAVKPLLERVFTHPVVNSRRADLLFDMPETAHISLQSNQQLKQYFACRTDNLWRVGVRIDRSQAQPPNEVIMRLYQIEGDSTSALTARRHELVQESPLEIERSSSVDWLELTIPPITHSEGKTFALEIEVTDCEETQELRPWFFHASPYPLLSAFSEEQALTNLGLCIRTHASETI